MSHRLSAVILAGGRSSRMGGGDKCLLPFGDGTILSQIVAVLRPQVSEIMINSNSDPRLFATIGLDVRPDAVPGRLGPLAGILTAMEWARESDHAYVLTASSDTPLLPHDLVSKLRLVSDGRCVVAASQGMLHPTIGLWPTALAGLLQRDLESGARSVRAWLNQVSFAQATFAFAGRDSFLNINTPEEWAAAARTEACSLRVV